MRHRRSGTENHRSIGINRGSETKNVDLESFGAYRSDGSGWPVVGGGNINGVVVGGEPDIQIPSKCKIYSHFEFHSMGFDEYMNLVLEDAEEVSIKKKTRKALGQLA
uniref:Sm protein E n=1 Tax=Lactuca sativa TaxID=4236 RepID=A0A9R1WW40_LACSA|nr:hypothetical protein LSAT_V11C800443840 [Lactuca sativa]